MRSILRFLFAFAVVLSVASLSFAAPTPAAAGPAKGPSAKSASLPAGGAKVDLNSATADQLVGLKGIGPSMAQAIIQYRTDHGGFGTVDDLMNVRGIGQKMLDKLRESITVVKK